MTALEMYVAGRYLRSRRGSRLLSFISVIAMGGVLVGVSALIVIMGVMNGLQKDLRDKILIASPDVRVLNYGEDMKLPDWRLTIAKVRQVKGVAAAAPFVLAQGLISAGHNYAKAAQIVGIEPQGPGVQEVTSIRSHVVPDAGDFRFASTDGEHRGIVLGKLLAEELNAYPGTKIRLVAPPPAGRMDAIFSGTYVPKFYTFEVTGLFETGMYEYDNSFVYLPLDVAREFAGLGEDVTGIEVRASDRWEAPEVAAAIDEKLGVPYRTMDWREQNRSLFQALKLEKLGMGVILLLIVLVAAFNIVSTLTMVVTDKTREIGILKAMGMTTRSIRRIFFAQGVMIGAVGTALGLATGLIASFAIDYYKLIPLEPSVYFIDHLPVATQPMDVVFIVVASLAIAALATLYPARQAARLLPIEAIRKE